MASLLYFVVFFFVLTGGGADNERNKTKEVLQDIYDIAAHTVLSSDEIKNVTVRYEDIQYFLFTQKNCNELIQIDATNATQMTNKDATIVVLFHGWGQNRSIEWYEDLKNAFCNRPESYYIIEVDYSQCADNRYVTSAYCCNPSGDFIGEFIVNLHKKQSLPLENFLLIGHSLGGQVSGAVGQKVKQLTGTKLKRIFALDPAGPNFNNRPPGERLSEEDAEVVAVIHTSAGTFGMPYSCGTIDFYPNGGSLQPGCLGKIPPDLMCSHHRSYKFFTEYVLKMGSFLAKRCKCSHKRKCHQVSMIDLNITATGDYCLDTESTSPYSKTK